MDFTSSNLIHNTIYGLFWFHALNAVRLFELSTLTGKYLQQVLIVLVSIQSIIDSCAKV